MMRDAVLVADLPAGDRITPIVAAARERGTRFAGLLVEMPDTNDGKALSDAHPPAHAAPREGACARPGSPSTTPRSPDRLHVFFVGGRACYVGVSAIDNSSPLADGHPAAAHAARRAVALHAEARRGDPRVPRTTRKREAAACPGMTAVDLGASPGGWTWQLVQRGLR